MSVGSVVQRGPRRRGGRTAEARPLQRALDDRALLALAGLTVVAAALRFWGLGRQGFWYDEANTAALVHYSPGNMLGLIPQSESTPPLYYLVAWVWARVFGFGEAGLRSLSAVCGVLTVPFAYGAARRLLGSRWAGLTVAALTACSPLLIWYSQEARSYEMLVLLTAAGLMAFAHAREQPTGRAVGAWALASALALATHYYAVVAVVPEAVWLVAVHGRRRAVQAGVGVVALCGLALVPLAISQNGTGRDSWIAHSPLGIRLAQIIPQFLIGTDLPHRQAFKLAAFALALVGLALLAFAARPAERRRALVGGGLAVAGFVLALLFIAAGFDTLITRNIIDLWLPAAVCVGGGLAARRTRALGAAITAALCAIGIYATVSIATTYDLQRPDWRPVARILGPRPTAGMDRVILIQHYKDLLPLSLYVPGLRFLRAPAAHRVQEIDVVSVSSPQQPLCWWGAACNLIPSQMQARYAIPGFRELWLRRSHRFEIMRLWSDRPVTVTRAEVARALRTTSLPRDDLLFQRRA